MSYTSTVERKRRRKMFRGSDDFKTINEFRGQAVRGELSTIEWANAKEKADIRLPIHVNEEAAVNSAFINGKNRDFVVLEIATRIKDSSLTNLAEVNVFVSVEQARVLRDQLNALYDAQDI